MILAEGKKSNTCHSPIENPCPVFCATVISEPLPFSPVDTFNLGTLRVPEQDPEEAGEIVGFGPGDLRKHVAVLGSTGSGKTVVSKGIIEECALAGIPVIAIDVQGDLAHLARPPEDDPRSDPERQSEWVRKTDVRVWTPLSEHGLPICLDLPPSGDNDSNYWAHVGNRDVTLGSDPRSPRGRQDVPRQPHEVPRRSGRGPARLRGAG